MIFYALTFAVPEAGVENLSLKAQRFISSRGA